MFMLIPTWNVYMPEVKCASIIMHVLIISSTFFKVILEVRFSDKVELTHHICVAIRYWGNTFTCFMIKKVGGLENIANYVLVHKV